MGLVERRRHTLQHTLQRTLQHTLQNTLQHPVHSCGDLWEGGGVCTKTESNGSSNGPCVTFWTFYCQKWWGIWSTYISRSMTFSIVRIAFMSRTLKRGSITLTYTHENTHTHTQHTMTPSLSLTRARTYTRTHTQAHVPLRRQERCEIFQVLDDFDDEDVKNCKCLQLVDDYYLFVSKLVNLLMCVLHT